MQMTKAQALAHISALYRTFNAADAQDSEDRADWTTPNMAADGCKPLEMIIKQILTKEEREEFYANL